MKTLEEGNGEMLRPILRSSKTRSYFIDRHGRDPGSNSMEYLEASKSSVSGEPSVRDFVARVVFPLARLLRPSIFPVLESPALEQNF